MSESKQEKIERMAEEGSLAAYTGATDAGWLRSQIVDLKSEIDRLKEENEKLRAEVKEWLCDKCRYVYNGPPTPRFDCVICPKCEGTTGPRSWMEKRELKAMCDELAGALEKISDIREPFPIKIALEALKKYTAFRSGDTAFRSGEK